MTLYLILSIFNLPFFIFGILTKKSRIILLLNVIVYVAGLYILPYRFPLPFFTTLLVLAVYMFLQYSESFLGVRLKGSIRYLVLALLGLLFLLALRNRAFDIISRVFLVALFFYLGIQNINLFFMKRNRVLTLIFFTGAVAFFMPFHPLVNFFIILWFLELIIFNFMIVWNYIKALNKQIEFQAKEKRLLLEYMEDTAVKVFSEVGFEYISSFVDRIIFAMTKVEGYMIYMYEGEEFVPLYMGNIFPPLFKVSENVLTKEEHIKDSVMSRRLREEEFYFSRVLKEKKKAIFKDIANLSQFAYLKNSPIDVGNLAVFPLVVRDTPLGLFFVRSASFFDSKEISLIDTIAHQIATYLYTVKMRDDLLKKQRIEKELEMSHEIQFSLLPSTFPSDDFCEIYGKLVPAREMGGDYFEILKIDDGIYDVIVGDVSGKGIPAALLMVILRTLIKIYASKELQPRDLLLKINKVLVRDLREDMFITLLYARYIEKEGKLIYVSAGHNNPLLIDCENQEIKNLAIEGIALGILEDIDDMLKQYSIDLKPGHAVFIYTDGVTEAKSKENHFFDLERLEQKLLQYCNLNAKDIVEEIYKKLRSFMEGVEQYDDITMLLLKVKK